MDAQRFERMVRSLTVTASRRQALGGVVDAVLASMVGHDSFNAAAKRKKGKGKKGKGKRPAPCVDTSQVTICHNGQTLTISNCALPTHLAHGDTPGACCIPRCTGKTCGPDGCGGTCGGCGAVPCASNGACDCTGQADLTDCGDGRTCMGQICATEPACPGINSPCIVAIDCCSHVCVGGVAGSFCGSGLRGQPCHSRNECNSGRCVGFVCA